MRVVRAGDHGPGVIPEDYRSGVPALRATHLRANLERDAPTCRLTALVVHTSARRRGVGRTLLEAVISEAERQGCERVEVTLRPEREAAEALYRSAGFEERPLRLILALGAG